MIKNKKKGIALAVLLLAEAGLCLGASKNPWTKEQTEEPGAVLLMAERAEDGLNVAVGGKNLTGERKLLGFKSGVSFSADSEESKEFSAKNAGDGIKDDSAVRWSSSNDWENIEHWLMASFDEPKSVNAVRIFWERANAVRYSLEYSQDGENWETALFVTEENPGAKAKQECLILPETVTAPFFRLHVFDVAKNEEDLTLYYQNVSVYEMEFYEDADVFQIQTPEITDTENGRTLQTPQVPQGYELTFAGSDYEEVTDDSGHLFDNLEERTIQAGYTLSFNGESWDLPGIPVKIPAVSTQEDTSEQENVKPSLIPAIAEWKGAEGTLLVEDKLKIVCQGEVDTGFVAQFEKELEGIKNIEEVIIADSETDFSGEETAAGEKEADGKEAGGKEVIVLLSLNPEDGKEESLQEEGYRMEISEQIKISANTMQGMRWGMVSLEQLLQEYEGKLPKGEIRDYPRYPVRSFGIDVGRRPVSLSLLYQIADTMSEYKMNELLVHLNDNQIIASSSYDGTSQGALSLYAGFRLETEVADKEGNSLTSTDVYYTKEEFADFIEYCRILGITVVPEIDTPAHSLFLTRAYPEYGLLDNPESADQLDLSKEGAVNLVKSLWAEYLEGEEPLFSEELPIHLGMDEYYGKGQEYLDYLTEMTEFVKGYGENRAVRIWGSLSNIEGDKSAVSRQLQLYMWEPLWADPVEMYEEGFSLINTQSSRLYIIPGGGYDWLDKEKLQTEWEPCIFQGEIYEEEIPAWSSKLLGACYMMWNDTWAAQPELIDEQGLYERFCDPVDVISQKLWQ